MELHPQKVRIKLHELDQHRKIICSSQTLRCLSVEGYLRMSSAVAITNSNQRHMVAGNGQLAYVVELKS